MAPHLEPSSRYMDARKGNNLKPICGAAHHNGDAIAALVHVQSAFRGVAKVLSQVQDSRAAIDLAMSWLSSAAFMLGAAVRDEGLDPAIVVELNAARDLAQSAAGACERVRDELDEPGRFNSQGRVGVLVERLRHLSEEFDELVDRARYRLKSLLAAG